MERDALAGHGISGFLRESLMERADKTQFRVCNGCGTVPITNENQGLTLCPLCDGPVSFIGTNSTNIEILPAARKSLVTTSVVEMPYATKLLADELQTYMNMGLRFLTSKGLDRLGQPALELPREDEVKAALAKPLPVLIMPETRVPEFREEVVEAEPAEEDLYAIGVVKPAESDLGEMGDIEDEFPAYNVSGTPPFAPAPPPALGPTEAGTPPFALGPVEVGTPQYNTSGTPPFAPSMPQQQPLPQQQPQLQPQPLPQQPQLIQMPLPQPQQQQIYQMPQQQQVYQMQQPQLIQMPQPQPLPQQQGGSYQYVMPQPIVYTSPVPNGPPTFVVDTSAQAMQQGGYLETYQQAAGGMPVMGRRQHQTPRGRASSPKRGVTFGGEQVSSSTKIMVSKLG
jgi:hypothetical protein